ncbi:MAG: M48 family metallopeptidase [Sphingomonas taxi]
MKSIRVEERGPQDWGTAVALEPHYAPMIERLERSALADPRGHGLRVLAAGMLGYAVLASTLLLFCAIIVGSIVFLVAHPGAAAVWGIKLLIPIGGIALSLILALRIVWAAPDGIAVTAQETPTLHDMVERIRRRVRGPRIHAIRVTDAMNAAITQYPRVLFLPPRNLLFLGLPLLQVLEQREIEAVIAHEMGHFVGAHGRTASFVYHVRTRWAQLGQRLPTGIVAGALRRFFDWYGPWFAAYSFVLARQQEYQADACAAAVVGPDTMADALVRTECQSARWYGGWRIIWAQAVERPDPPTSPYRLLATSALEGADEDAPETLQRALEQRADLDDTHPSLAQRLAALGLAPRVPPPVVRPAATTLLGSALDDIIDRLDADWHACAKDAWADTYRERQEAHAERQGLEDAAATGELDQDQQHRLAQLIEVIDGPQRGAAAYADVLARFPHAHGSRFRHGDALLDIGEDAGIASLLAAAQGAPELRVAAFERIVRYAYVSARQDLVETFEPQLDAAVAVEQGAYRLSSSIDEMIELRPLDPDKRDELVRLVAAVAGVKWLKAGVRDLAAGPQIVFVFATRRDYGGVEVLDALIEQLLPAGDLIGIQHSRSRGWLTKRLKQLPNSSIWG